MLGRIGAVIGGTFKRPSEVECQREGVIILSATPNNCLALITGVYR